MGGRAGGERTDCHRKYVWRGESPEEGADCFQAAAAAADGIGAGRMSLFTVAPQTGRLCAGRRPECTARGGQEMTAIMPNVPFASGVPLQ